jgi:GntR family transcriptional regulator
MYQQIADDLRRQIESGTLKPGQQLPTEIHLRDQYNASRNTVRDAIKRLLGLGLVETRPGAGTFVTRKIDPFITVLTQDAQTGYGGARLRLRPGAQVVFRHQERYIDGTSWSLQTSYFPMKWVTSGKAPPRLLLAEDIPEGTVRYLEGELGIRQTSYRDWITARAPDDNEQRLLGIAHDSMVFEVFRSAFIRTGRRCG